MDIGKDYRDFPYNTIESGMITMNILLKLLLIPVFLSATRIFAQESTDQIVVPMSEPGRPGFLVVDHVKGSIIVTGYNGDMVIISAARRNISKETKGDERADGMKIISQHDTDLSASRNKNDITVKTNSHKYTNDLTIQVPRAFSLRLSTIDNGKIVVYGVSGELEISNLNGDIELNEISGAAVLNTIDGNIRAKFSEVFPDMPMAFTTIHGTIEVSLPADTKALLKMKSQEGTIYTNFNLEVEKRNQVVEKSKTSGAYTVFLDNWKYAKINGGGAEMLFNTLDGNIYIRKRE